MRLRYLHTGYLLYCLALLLLLATGYSYAQDSVPTKSYEAYFHEAMTYRHQNKLDLALGSLEDAAKVAEQNDNMKAVIDALHKFSIVYLELDKKSNSEVYWDRANAQLKKMEYPFGNAVQKYISGLYKYREGNNFQAIAEMNEAKQLTNDRNLVNNILLAEANIYLALEKYDVATKNFNSLIINTDPFEQQFLTTKASLGLAKLHLAMGNLEEGATNAENALKLAKENKFFVEIVASNELLASIYEQMVRYDLSLQNVRNLLTIKDSLFTSDKLKTENKAAQKIQFDFLTNEITRLEEKNEELSQEARSSELTAILTSAFLTIISLLAVSLYRNNQIKLKTNDLLQTKNNELQSARDAAVQAMEAKTNFLSTVSHELRTPLYAVTGLTHLLLEENPSKNQKEHLKALKFSGDYLLNFINDILHINKIDADKLEPLTIEFNLKKVLKEVIDSLQQSAKENKTKILLEYDEDIPSHLMSDPLKLSQIFMNLVGNALKFTKNGEVKVIARLMKKFEEDVTLYFEVADTGIGISKDQQENIFEGFEQGSIQINREYGGTGLGLTIVKSLLGLFGSKIQLESELGKGSSFFFELKLKSKESAIDDVTFEITDTDYDFKGLHILIVEDNKINQVITKKMLTKKEITSEIANNGAEAVEMARKNNYDAILMDIHMPGISGEEATIEIRKFDQQTPIVALTAISLDDSLESFYAAGCDDVVTKPFKPEVFYQKIGENIFQNKRIKNTAS